MSPKTKSKNASSLDQKQNKRLQELEDTTKQLQDKLARSLADYSNLEKRIESQRQLFVTLATTDIISKMIEILDDLYLTQSHLKDPGLKMVIDKFHSTLVSQGLEEIKAESEIFNPETMDCVEVAPGPQDQVITVKKRGYKLNGHVIRPAQVLVGKDDSKK